MVQWKNSGRPFTEFEMCFFQIFAAELIVETCQKHRIINLKFIEDMVMQMKDLASRIPPNNREKQLHLLLGSDDTIQGFGQSNRFNGPRG